MRNKFTPARFSRVAMLAIVATLTMEAAPSQQMRWKDLATYLRGKLVTITTKDGKTVSGRTPVVWPDGISFTDVPSSTVPRDAVVSLHWEAPYERQTHKLGRLLSSGYRHAGRNLGTTMGPVALVEFPVITAWGAATAPFCLLGDLFAGHPQTSGDISILPDGQGVSK